MQSFIEKIYTATVRRTTLIPAIILLCAILAGCVNLPDHNYIGMTKAEVAAHLEKHAFRAKWSGNRFKISIPKSYEGPNNYKNAQEVCRNPLVMAENEWHCDFYPQRHWLLGWNGLAARWFLWKLYFKDGKVVRQQRAFNYYWVYGYNGESPHPKLPKNFFQVDKELYRSGQPDEDEFETLYSFHNIRSVLNLRKDRSDKEDIKAINQIRKNPIALYELSLKTGKITEHDLIQILRIIRKAPKPLLIHCWQGSNRTSCAVAAYRIAFQNWTVEDAIEELMKPEYGHHKWMFRNIPALLRSADWKKIKQEALKEPCVIKEK